MLWSCTRQDTVVLGSAPKGSPCGGVSLVARASLGMGAVKHSPTHTPPRQIMTGWQFSGELVCQTHVVCSRLCRRSQGAKDGLILLFSLRCQCCRPLSRCEGLLFLKASLRYLLHTLLSSSWDALSTLVPFEQTLYLHIALLGAGTDIRVHWTALLVSQPL